MGRTGSALILLVVALGLGGYLYFVESERSVADPDAKKKVFTYDAATINQVQIKSSGGEVTSLRKGADNTWTIVRPVQATADRNSISEVVTSLSSLEEQRVVDENAADLKAYGLAEPRVDVTFHVDGDKEPKRILLGEKTPASSGTYAKLSSGNRVFLVDTAVEAAVDKPTFDFRDKAALTFDQAKVTSIELASAAQTIRIEKSGDEWKLVKPVQAPADFVSVNGVLGQLQSADALQRIAREVPSAERPGLLHGCEDQQEYAVEPVEDQRPLRLEGKRAEDQQRRRKDRKRQSASAHATVLRLQRGSPARCRSSGGMGNARFGRWLSAREIRRRRAPHIGRTAARACHDRC